MDWQFNAPKTLRLIYNVAYLIKRFLPSMLKIITHAEFTALFARKKLRRTHMSGLDRSARFKLSLYTHAQLPRLEIRLKFVLEP